MGMPRAGSHDISAFFTLVRRLHGVTANIYFTSSFGSFSLHHESSKKRSQLEMPGSGVFLAVSQDDQTLAKILPCNLDRRNPMACEVPMALCSCSVPSVSLDIDCGKDKGQAKDNQYRIGDSTGWNGLPQEQYMGVYLNSF